MKVKTPVLLLICIFLMSFTIATQVKLTRNMDSSPLVSISQVNQYQRELALLVDKKNQKKEELLELEIRLDKIKQTNLKYSRELKDIESELQLHKMSSGMTDVIGPGLIIVIQKITLDIYEYEEEPIYYEIILKMINQLKDSGAEAISINGQRIVNTSAIYPARGGGIVVNDISQSMPLTIKAIGNPQIMESSIKLQHGIYDEMIKTYDFKVSISQVEKVEINQFIENVHFTHAKPLPE